MSVDQESRFGRNEGVSALIASVVAAALAGGIIQGLGGVAGIEQFAQLVGATGLVTGWAVWLGQGVVLGAVFALGLTRTINPFSELVIRITTASSLLRRLLVPLLRRAALPVTTGSMGFLYGQFLLVPLFAYLAPVVLAVQGHSVGVPLATLPVVLGYVVYGTVLGTTHGVVLATPWFNLHRIGDEHRAAFVGAVAGGAVGTGVLAAVGGTDLLVKLGAVSGTATATRGALLFVAVALGFGLAFAWVLARTINDFTNTVIMFSRRSELTQKILVPLLTRAALTVTAGAMGLVYGLVLGTVAVGLGAAGVLPQTGLAGLLSCTLYGSVLGNTYGLVMEDVDLSGLGPSEAQQAGLIGSVSAGAVSAGVLALTLGPSVFRAFAEPLGVIGRFESAVAGQPWLLDVAPWVPDAVRPAVGGALWMGVAVAFGLLFVTYVSRTINDFTNTVIMFSRRSELTQKVLVPLLTRAALTVTAGAMGLLYGLVLGAAVVGLGTVGVLPQTGLAGLLACTVYGSVLGNTYGLVMEDIDLSGLGPSEELRAGFVGSVGAGLLSGGVLALALGPSVFDTLAALVGTTGRLVGAGVWMGVAVTFGLVFVAYISRTINDFTNTVIMVSRRSTLTQKLLVPLLMRAALTVTAGAMGFVYGLVLGLLVYGGVLAGILPQVSPLVVVAFVVYGQALGTNYGLLLEDVDLSRPSLPDWRRNSDDDSVSLIEIDTDWRPPIPLLFSRGDDTDDSGSSVSLIEFDADWRPRRPAAGAVALLAAGTIVGGLPLQRGLPTEPSPAVLGVVVGAMLVACGLFVLVKPQLSTLAGVTGVALAAVSIVAGFGGLFVGMVLGLVGGTLCIVWEDPAERDQSVAYGLVRVGETET